MGASQLSRRERQIMDILYQRGKATAAEVKVAMDDAPSFSPFLAITSARQVSQKARLKRLSDHFFALLPECFGIVWIQRVPPNALANRTDGYIVR